MLRLEFVTAGSILLVACPPAGIVLVFIGLLLCLAGAG